MKSTLSDLRCLLHMYLTRDTHSAQVVGYTQNQEPLSPESQGPQSRHDRFHADGTIADVHSVEELH